MGDFSKEKREGHLAAPSGLLSTTSTAVFQSYVPRHAASWTEVLTTSSALSIVIEVFLHAPCARVFVLIADGHRLLL